MAAPVFRIVAENVMESVSADLFLVVVEGVSSCPDWVHDSVVVSVVLILAQSIHLAGRKGADYAVVPAQSKQLTAET